MAGRLTTHVLDTALGRPAAGMRIRLYCGARLLADKVTNADGRTDAALVSEGNLAAGEYRIEFEVGEYFAALASESARHFLNVVPVVFTVDEPDRSYHVPLLVSPWSYSTYRGS